MKSVKQLTAELISKVKRMQTFRILKAMPDSFEFNGQVPFDIKIKDNIMCFTVHAVTLEEATRMVNQYLQDNSDVEW